METKKLIAGIRANANGRNSNGAATLAYVLHCRNHVTETGDWTPAALMVSLAEGAPRSRIVALFASVGMFVRPDKKQPSGFKIVVPAAGFGANFDPVAVLQAYVEMGTTYFGKVLETGVKTETVDIPPLLPKEQKEYDIAALGRAVLKAKAEGYSVEAIAGYVARVLRDAQNDDNGVRLIAAE